MLSINALTFQKAITALTLVTIIWLATSLPYGHMGITNRTMLATLIAGISVGAMGAIIDLLIGYRMIRFERFLMWVTVTVIDAYLVSVIIPGVQIPAVSIALTALTTALVEILMPARV